MYVIFNTEFLSQIYSFSTIHKVLAFLPSFPASSQGKYTLIKRTQCKDSHHSQNILQLDMPPFTDIHGGPALPGRKGRGGNWGVGVGQ